MQNACRNGSCPECVGVRLDKAKERWNRAMRTAMQEWQALKAESPFGALLKTTLYAAGLCTECRFCASSFDRRYREMAPDFPL